MSMAFKCMASRGQPTIESEANTLNNTSAHQDPTWPFSVDLSL